MFFVVLVFFTYLFKFVSVALVIVQVLLLCNQPKIYSHELCVMSGINMFLKPKSLYKWLFQMHTICKLLTTVCTKLLWQLTWSQMPKASYFLGQWKIGKLWKSSSNSVESLETTR